MSARIFNHRDALMASAAEQSDLAQEVFLPIPANALRPRHKVVVVAMKPSKVKFESLARAAGFADMAELRDQCSAKQ